jgi:hypothetical protein
MHDTIKKPQDILDVGYTVRYPHLVNVTGVADIDAEVCISALPPKLHNNLTKLIAQSGRSEKASCHRAAGARNHLLQFHNPNGISICD